MHSRNWPSKEVCWAVGRAAGRLAPSSHCRRVEEARRSALYVAVRMRANYITWLN